MALRRDDLTPGQKTLRSAGLTVIILTVILCGGIAYSYLAGDQGTGWRQLASAVGLVAAAVALVAMLVDAFDQWVRGGLMTDFNRKMTRSFIFVAMLVAVALSIAGGTPLFFILMTPALMTYLFGVVRRRPEPIRRPSDLPGRRAPGAAGRSAGGRADGRPRQRRGGKKRT